MYHSCLISYRVHDIDYPSKKIFLGKQDNAMRFGKREQVIFICFQLHYRYNTISGKLDASVTVFKKSELNVIGRFIMNVFRTFKIVKWEEDNDGVITCNNLTLINFVIIVNGPTKEPQLTMILLCIQVINGNLNGIY